MKLLDLLVSDRQNLGAGLGRQIRPCVEQFDQFMVVENGITEKCVGKCVAPISEPPFSREIWLLFESYPGSLM